MLKKHIRAGGVGPVRALCAGSLIGLSSVPVLANAAASSFMPMASLEAEYSDNRNLDEGPAQKAKVHGGNARVGFDYRLVGPRTELTFRPAVEFTEYRGDEHESTDNQYVYMRARHKWERGYFTLTGNYERETTFSSDVAEVDFPDEGTGGGETDTGIVTVRGRRQTAFITPEARWEIGERSSMLVSGNFLDVNYTGLPDNVRSDFKNFQGSLGFDRRIGPRSSVGIVATVGRYEADINDVETNFKRAELTYSYRVTEASTIELSAGAQDIDQSSSNAIGRSRTDAVVSARWTNQGEVTRWQAYIGRSIDPSGSATLSRRDQVRVTVERRMSERMTVLGGARWISTQPKATGALVVGGRDYGRLQAGFKWNQTQTLSFTLLAMYTYQDFESRPGHANEFGATLEIAYKGLGSALR